MRFPITMNIKVDIKTLTLDCLPVCPHSFDLDIRMHLFLVDTML